ALLPFTGEDAYRTRKGPMNKPFSRLREKVPGGRMRARERSEALPLTLLFEGPGKGQQQLAALAPSSGAARHLLPLRRRRAASPRQGRTTGGPSAAAREKSSV